VSTFCDLFDREQVAWRRGIGDDGFAVEGEQGQRLRHAWEDAYADLRDAWDAYSRRLEALSASIVSGAHLNWWCLGGGYVVRGGGW
jgi:hypothetical protein